MPPAQKHETKSKNPNKRPAAGSKACFCTRHSMMDRAGFLWCSILLVGVANLHSAAGEGFITSPFQADVWASNVTTARGLEIDEAGDVLVVSRGAGIVALWEDADGRVDRTLIVNNENLTHGITIHGRYLYASSGDVVWRWSYTAGRRRVESAPQVVVRNIQNDEDGNSVRGNHFTRTLAAADGILYVSVGSIGNVDSNSYRARLRSFDLERIPAGGHDFADGAVFADGLRNEVGLAFDARGRLWGVENGADELVRDDLGGDIHNDNPGEEMNLFDGPPGSHYGYPYCWTEYNLPNGTGQGRGSQWAWPTLINSTITDSWCRNASNNRPPETVMQAHSAPLGVTFFSGANCGGRLPASDARNNETLYAFGCEYAGDAFVALHGSWNRDVAVGYKVVRIKIDPSSGLPVAGSAAVQDIFGQVSPESTCGTPAGVVCIRPVDLKFTRGGALLVTADASGEIYRIVQSSNSSSSITVDTPSPSPSPMGSSATRVALLSTCSVLLATVLSSLLLA
ncbi:hypothetical protein MPTK1_6g10030 [Marchantia polymorpha subsp. ruderalis]|nr:hypothetical protein MARPO_0016s0046 [Marchantia polymorpha]BBN14244.1 hypothetical protein Mp_6g10030 [Marchantia polymorpha subsp. ruderalis]|eukprot:PTQ44979.1 hypothetical protein MARPO_0016s0046 [Marchantia polymorpha]